MLYCVGDLQTCLRSAILSLIGREAFKDELVDHVLMVERRKSQVLFGLLVSLIVPVGTAVVCGPGGVVSIYAVRDELAAQAASLVSTPSETSCAMSQSLENAIWLM